MEHGHFIYPLEQHVRRKMPEAGGRVIWSAEPLKNEDGIPLEIDDAIFHKQPTSFFTIDNRIPEKIRKPLNEADNCRVNNFLTGGSACVRRAIYELFKAQEIPSVNEKGKQLDYGERMKLLKKKLVEIDEDYFDILNVIKGVTSTELHENPWEEFNNPTLKLLIETTEEVLYRIYVEPEEKKTKKTAIQKLYEKATANKGKADTPRPVS
jgi:hypothetical protein